MLYYQSSSLATNFNTVCEDVIKGNHSACRIIKKWNIKSINEESYIKAVMNSDGYLNDLMQQNEFSLLTTNTFQILHQCQFLSAGNK